MRRTILLVCAALMSIAAPAVAKGPFEAVIDGPGVEEPIVVDDETLGRLVNSIEFWPLAYGWNDPVRVSPIVDAAPTAVLGPEYTITVLHMGPAGDASVDVLVYPEAEGGPLAFVEPGMDVEEMQTTTVGGWIPLSSDITSILESHGVAVPTVDAKEAAGAASIGQTEAKAIAEDGTPILLLVAGAGLSVVVVWALWMRPRRMAAQ